MAGEPRTCLGRHGDRIRDLDEYLESMRRCDRNIADAEGDVPLQAFWRGEKAAYQSDLSRQDKTAMPTRLLALDEGPDILVGRTPVLVGRHPRCDARLDSIRASRFHCCLAEDDGEVLVRDLGSANGIRINGRRVESGRLRLGDELSIAHIRYRVEDSRAE
ncbi:MAG TPA: FHA domain-containing protein [Isosphaeraceae bacterium]|nr:FHA domain-containing protein [Isosphaeraceae bacterium]